MDVLNATSANTSYGGTANDTNTTLLTSISGDEDVKATMSPSLMGGPYQSDHSSVVFVVSTLGSIVTYRASFYIKKMNIFE